VVLGDDSLSSVDALNSGEGIVKQYAYGMALHFGQDDLARVL